MRKIIINDSTHKTFTVVYKTGSKIVHSHGFFNSIRGVAVHIRALSSFHCFRYDDLERELGYISAFAKFQDNTKGQKFFNKYPFLNPKNK